MGSIFFDGVRGINCPPWTPWLHLWSVLHHSRNVWAHAHMKQEGLSNIKVVPIFALSNTILLWHVRTSGMMYYAFVG